MAKIDMNTVETPLETYKTISVLFNRTFNLCKYPYFTYKNLKFVLDAPKPNVIHSPA